MKAYPQQHPRVAEVQQAETAVRAALQSAIAAHNLTYGEITTVLSRALLAWAGYQVDDERAAEARARSPRP